MIKARCAIFLCGKEVFSEKQDLVSHTVGNLICIHQFEKYLGNRSLKFHARTNKRNAVQVPISTCYEVCKQGTVRPGCCFLQYGFKGLLERQERENGLGTRVMFSGFNAISFMNIQESSRFGLCTDCEVNCRKKLGLYGKKIKWPQTNIKLTNLSMIAVFINGYNSNTRLLKHFLCISSFSSSHVKKWWRSILR